MCSAAHEDSTLALLKNYSPYSNTSDSILDALHSCPLPWSSELCDSVASWLIEILKTTPMNSNNTPSRLGPKETLQNLSSFLPQSLYTELLKRSSEYLETELQKERLYKPTGFVTGMGHGQRLHKLKDFIQFINELQVFPSGIDAGDESSLTFAEFKLRLTASNIEKISAALKIGKPTGDFKIEGCTPLEFAVKANNLELIDALLETGFSASEIQAAFKLAADKGYTDAALRFIQAGADYKVDYHHDGGEGQRCPICFVKVQPPSGSLCAHWICRSERRLYGRTWLKDWDYGANFTLNQLANLLDATILSDKEFDVLQAEAPVELRSQIGAVRRKGIFYWTEKEGIISESFVSAKGSGELFHDFFSTQAGLASKIKQEGNALLKWLSKSDSYHWLQRRVELANLGKIREMLSSGAGSDALRIDNESPIEYAARLGEFKLVKALVKAGAATPYTHYALFKAADAGHLKIARYLSQKGTDHNFNYKYDHNDGPRCPFCFKLRGCEHWVCSSNKKQVLESFYAEDFDFESKVANLANQVNNLEEDELAAVLTAVPSSVAASIEAARAYGKLYWAKERAVFKVKWRTSEDAKDHGFDYFHPKRDFALQVKNTAQTALEWLKDNLEVVKASIKSKKAASEESLILEVVTGKSEVSSGFTSISYPAVDIETTFRDYEQEEQEEQEEQHCPICSSLVSRSELNYCQHLVCIDLSGYDEFWPFSDDFYNNLKSLSKLIKGLAPANFKALLQAAPPEQVAVYTRIKKYGLAFWKNDPGMEEVFWETNNYNSDAGTDYFHPEPGYSETITSAVDNGLAWLKENRPELCDEFIEDEEVQAVLDKAVKAADVVRIRAILDVYVINFTYELFEAAALNGQSEVAGLLAETLDSYESEKLMREAVKANDLELVKVLVKGLGTIDNAQELFDSATS